MKQKIHYLSIILVLILSSNTLWAQTEIDINGNGRPYSVTIDSLQIRKQE